MPDIPAGWEPKEPEDTKPGGAAGETPDTADAGDAGDARGPEAAGDARGAEGAGDARGAHPATTRAMAGWPGAGAPPPGASYFGGPQPGGPYGGSPYVPEPGWLDDVSTRTPAPVTAATLWAALVTGVLGALLLADGLAVNLLLLALPAAVAAYAAARHAGRRPRPWTLTWAIGCLALLVVPALRDAGWPVFLSVIASFTLGALALNGARTWPAVLLAPLDPLHSLVTSPGWVWRGIRARVGGSRGRTGQVLRAVVVTVVLLVVFGALFAGADAAFADLLDALTPDVSGGQGPLRLLLFLLGLAVALSAAHTAAAPTPWDRAVVPPGRPGGRVEWALPLVVLAVLFAAFNVIQLTVLFGGYEAVLTKTGQTYSEYARQGFWQLLTVTVLFLIVVIFAVRRAPRGNDRDRVLVKGVLGTLCALALVVVASAVRRMDMYVDAYGLTRLRISVMAVEIWLGVVIVLVMAAGVWGARLLPRAVAASAAAGVLIFGLMSPDAVIAEHNVQRYEKSGMFDVEYANQLSADAVPALDKLEEPLRSCALVQITQDLDRNSPWYATSWATARARGILGPAKFLPVLRYGPPCSEYRDQDQDDDTYDYSR